MTTDQQYLWMLLLPPFFDDHNSESNKAKSTGNKGDAYHHLAVKAWQPELRG